MPKIAVATLSLAFAWLFCLFVLPAGVAQAEESTASSPATADEALATPDNEVSQERVDDSSGLESADDNSDCIAENAPKADDQNVDEPTIDGPVSDELVDEMQPEREPVEAQQAETTNRAEENGTKEEVAGTLEPQANAVYATVAVTAVDAETGTYTVVVSGIECPQGVRKVQLPTWSAPGGQDDLVWHTAARRSDGSYSYTVAMTDHSWAAGVYITHAYVTDGNGAVTRVGAVEQRMDVPQPKVDAALDGTLTKATVTVVAPRATAVRIPVWSADKGQDDLVWYDASRRSDGTWRATVPLSAHRSTGTFDVHCYATVGGKQSFVGDTTFAVAAPTAAVEVAAVDAETGTYTVKVSGIECPQGVRKVQLPTWAKPGQSDIRWYTAARQPDGSYSYTVAMADHSWVAGVYITHAYVTDGNGAVTRVGAVEQRMDVPQPKVDAALDGTLTKATVTVVAPRATAVRIPVWSADKGQDDLVWYDASRRSDGTWRATVPLSAHRSTGTFDVHCYATVGGKQSFVGNTTFAVAAPTAAVEVAAVDAESGTYTVVVSGIECPQGVSKVQLPTWSAPGGQDDLVWHTAARQPDGSYSLTVAMADHSWTAGAYQTHAYITDGNGAMTRVGTVAQSMNVPETGTTVVLSSDEMTTSLSAFDPRATAMTFAVWSSNNGQDDLVWYKAAKRSEGVWTTNVPIAAHHDAGVYQVHSYATIGGKKTCIDRDTFTVTSPTAVLTVTPNENDSAVIIQVSGINSPSGVTKVQVPMWSETGGQDDIIWYALSGNASQGYSTTADLGKHYFKSGAYILDCYLTTGNGITAIAASAQQDLDPQLRGVINVISDTQLRPYYNSETEHLADVLADVERAGGTDHFVLNGDITQYGQQDEYDIFKSIVADSSFSLSDFSVNMGNHEMRNDVHKESFEVLWARYRENFNLPANYRAEEIDGLRFIFLASDEEPSAGWISSHISAEQLAWLDEQLTANEAEGRTSFVCIHHPIINTINGSHPGQWAVNSWRGLENGQEVRDVLYRHSNVVVFTSHTHYDLNGTNVFRESDSTPLFVHTGAVAYSNNDDDVRGELCQGWYLFVFDDRVELRGRDFLNNTWVEPAKCTVF